MAVDAVILHDDLHWCMGDPRNSRLQSFLGIMVCING